MTQILSNIEVILLSIVNEKPSYAYEIDKTIESREMRRWVRIGVASIYQVLKKLERKKLVFSRLEKEGKMPDRKRYYITNEGNIALTEAAKRLLSGLEWYYLDLNVGLETSNLLTSEELFKCITKRLLRVQANKKVLKRIYASKNDKNIKKRAVIKNLLFFREAEETFLHQLLEELALSKSR